MLLDDCELVLHNVIDPVAGREVAPDCAVAEAFGAALDREYGHGGMSRPVVEYIGYTHNHLPMLDKKPEFANREEAIDAILAARIAFSSLLIRSLCRYGLRAISNPC